VSSTGGACWLDTQKQNLVLVCPSVVAFGEGEKEVNQFFEKVRRFSRKSFQIEEPILELVRKDLPKLKEALKSCNITLKKKTLVVVCLRNEVDNVAEKVENFLKNGTVYIVFCVFLNVRVGMIVFVRFLLLSKNLLYTSPSMLLFNLYIYRNY
jgi:hypothetical protein